LSSGEYLPGSLQGKISSDGCLKKEQMVVSAIASTPQNNKNALCMTEGNSEKIGKTDIQSFDGEKHPTVQGCFRMFLT
ncbi:hypothetical protein OTG69_26045, partial [Escherichia coli]|uniref:hypothetical protein n=1 Tax=Escherichia coli TaxID=562 RepID=UPI002263F297